MSPATCPNSARKMNDKDIRDAQPRANNHDIWDDQVKGLHVNITPKNTKAFYLRYRFGGRLRKKRIALYMKSGFKEPETTLATARRLARNYLNKISEGIDPFLETKRKVDQEEADALAKAARKTFAQLADDYMELYSKPHKDSWKRDQEILDRDVLPRLGAMPLEEIRKTDIDDVTLPILRRGSPSAANHCFEVMRAILNWGANKGYGGIEYSPMTGMKAPSPKGDGRERVLSEEEIRTAWDWFENGSDMHDLTRLIFKLTLVTGQRPGEVCQMEKEHVTVYGNHHIWTIPGAIRKTDQTHVVPLSGMAIEILEQVEAEKKKLDYVDVETFNPRLAQCLHCGTDLPVPKNRDGRRIRLQYCSEKCRSDRAVLLRKSKREPRFINSPFVFPSPQRRGKPFSESTLNTVLDRARDNDMTLEHWTPHDLRRTAGTHITGLVKESREIMDQVLGHKDGKVGAVYDRYAYFDEKCRALDGWSRELRRILKGGGEGSKVIPLYG